MHTPLRILLGLALVLSWGAWHPAASQASCEVHTTTPTYSDLTFLGVDLCDANGNKMMSMGTAGGLGTATAAAPTRVEGAAASFSFDLSGSARVNLTTLLAGEDQYNNLIMTSGGATRLTQLVGTGGIPSTASDATTTAQLLMTGKKTFLGIVTCTGTCVQTQKIYGAFENSATVAKSELLCTLYLNASTTAKASCIVDTNWQYYFVVTSATSGTTPLAGLFAMY